MSKAEKREQKIRENPNNVSLTEFEWLIRQYGKLDFGGNHALATFGDIRYPYRRHNPVSVHYVKELLKIIEVLKRK